MAKKKLKTTVRIIVIKAKNLLLETVVPPPFEHGSVRDRCGFLKSRRIHMHQSD